MIEFDYGKDITERSEGPDLTPMIDMIFLLLIFFLLTSFFVLPTLNVSLPQSRSAESKVPPALTVTIQSDGTLLFQGQLIAEPTLLTRLREIYAQQAEKAVIIQADKRVPFGRVVQVMELSKKAGVQDLSFLVERATDPGQ